MERIHQYQETMKKMKDLKVRVQKDLQHLDGRLIRNPRSVPTEKMLGLIDMDEQPHPDKRDGTILDPSHGFWDEYMRKVMSGRQAEEEVTCAILLLQDEGKFNLREPEVEGVDGMYINVEPVTTEEEDFNFEVEKVNGNLALQVEHEGVVYETILHKK